MDDTGLALWLTGITAGTLMRNGVLFEEPETPRAGVVQLTGDTTSGRRLTLTIEVAPDAE